jgi:hypothetical protein
MYKFPDEESTKMANPCDVRAEIKMLFFFLRKCSGHFSPIIGNDDFGYDDCIWYEYYHSHKQLHASIEDRTGTHDDYDDAAKIRCW